MALSFLCLAFTRILQLVRLGRRDSDMLAIEIIMPRHEVAVLRRLDAAQYSVHRIVQQIQPMWPVAAQLGQW